MTDRAERTATNAVPAEVTALVARFKEHAETYAAGGRGSYNETQIRREFIDPLFKALGWDIDNSAGYAEAYKDVIHEDAIRVGGATKAPDYCFRIGGVRRFFVEAKKPSVDIKADASPAYQLRRYAWSAKLPLSVLTDFEEIAVYDCRVKPDDKDKASTARTLYLRYDELPERWAELAAIFSRDAVLKGAFDRYADSSKRKRGTAEVDDAFLTEIEDWREMLARTIALRNEDLSQRDLNFAVQRTIDRIVFLRICEDRGIERYGTLQALTNGDKVYERLFERFRRADERYNSGLFHFSREKGRVDAPDDLTPSLTIDDKPLKDILRRLYYPECPYEFSVLPADILGHVYEQFLGKVIRLTPGHRAVVEEKPEVRKAGGVYYTPTYIVDSIVKQTVGALVEGKRPQEVGGLTSTWQPSKAKGTRPLTVLDPACGSGSFLLGAYQFLLDWYRDRYVADGPAKHTAGRQPRLYEHGSGDFRLTTAERKRILLTHIHGVDIDPQAVEVTKLSLLLKVLEGESADNVDAGLRLFRERALPDLGDTIKCGNSLIGPDFYDDTQMDLFDEEQRLKINVFDWKKEFPDIMRTGGFDAVIGNPPYVQIENIPSVDKAYYVRTYGEFGRLGKRFDLYQVFVLQAVRLFANTGRFGMILPNTFLMGHSYSLLRKRLVDNTRLIEIVDLPQGVFRGVTVDNVLLFFARESDSRLRSSHRIAIRKLRPKSDKTRLATGDWDEAYELLQADVADAHAYTINIHANPQQKRLFERLREHTCPLGSVTESSQGIILYRTSADAKASLHTGVVSRAGWKKLLRGRNIGRYDLRWGGEYVHYGDWLWCQREERFFNQKKILLQAMRNKSLQRRLVATLDSEHYYNAHNLANIIATSHSKYLLEYILGIINSSLMNFWYKAHFPNVNINPSDFRQIPIRILNFAVNLERQQHDRIVALVSAILELNIELARVRTAHAKAATQRQIEATDRKIDRLVYELYGLTEDDIRVVEEATA